jgi:prolyl 4-hydroxylase
MTADNSKTVIAEAEKCDARGDHDEAINVLARATQSGNQIAKTKLGKRLLVGDRSPYLPKEGAVFILEAAKANIAEAVSVVAVFQATGIYQEQNWAQALVTLTHAAALGSLSAREQILLLADQGESIKDPTLLENNKANYWTNIASKIKLESWLAPPEGRVLHEDPLIKTFTELLPAPVCRWLIRLSNNRLKPALVYDSENKRNYLSKTRTNSIAEFNLIENEFLHFLIQKKMSIACNIPMKQMEGTAILHYKPGEEISEHFDFVDPNLPNYEQEIRDNGQRIITFLIYLNEEYEGGETAFTELDLSYKGQTGDGIYFVNALPDGSSDLRTKHAGRPTSSGEKWIVSQFIRNREVKYVLE